MMWDRFTKNPFTEWIFWLIKKKALESRHPGFRLHYLAKANACRFGNGNVVMDKTVIMNSTLGDYTYVARECFIDNTVIGKFCSVGPFTRMGLGVHPLGKFVSSHPAFYSRRGQSGIYFADRDYVDEKITIGIGHDVWIGANVFISDGVQIGHGAVIAAGAVVSTNVAPYSIVGGVPAKPIRNRFPDEQIRYLLNAKWWDRDLEWLRKYFKEFHNIDGFINNAH